MKYRTKLHISLVSVAFLSVALGLGIVYEKTKSLVLSDIRSKALSIAATMAVVLNAEDLKQIKSPEDEGSPAYIRVRDTLRKLRDANRRKDLWVKFAYTIIPVPGHPDQLMFQVDAEESAKDVSHVGDRDLSDEKTGLLKHLHGNFDPGKFIQDQWGLWLSGFSPVFDSKGNYVATVGIDISAIQIIKEFDKLIIYGLWALLGAVSFSLIISLFLSRRVTLSLDSLYAGVKRIGRGELQAEVHLKTQDEFNDLANAINEMSKGLLERERLRMNFARYVSHHVLDRILTSDTPTKLEGERKKVTILFSDIRQFTHLAEKLSPEEVVSRLNQYFEKMLDVIFKHHGTLDKFIGDGLMVEFGAPLDDSEQEIHAIRTAIEMQQELKKLCWKWQSEGKESIDMGIGIHTGIAVVGNIGSEQRMEYTAVGDTVNVAARLEQATKILKAPILVSEMTFSAVKDRIAATNLGEMALPGRSDKITIYSIDIPQD